MNIVLCVVGEIVVDHKLDIIDIYIVWKRAENTTTFTTIIKMFSPSPLAATSVAIINLARPVRKSDKMEVMRILNN